MAIPVTSLFLAFWAGLWVGGPVTLTPEAVSFTPNALNRVAQSGALDSGARHMLPSRGVTSSASGSLGAPQLMRLLRSRRQHPAPHHRCAAAGRADCAGGRARRRDRHHDHPTRTSGATGAALGEHDYRIDASNLLTLGCLLGIAVSGSLSIYLVQTAPTVNSPEVVVAGLTVTDPFVAVVLGITMLGEATGALLWSMFAFAAAGAVAVWGVLDPARAQREPAPGV